MTRRLGVLAIFALIVSPAFGAEAGWEYLFNGQNLDGWKTVGVQDWSVEDGNIVAKARSEENGWLVTQREFGDFILRFRFKWSGGDSGTQFRSHFEGDEMAGYQANLDAGRQFATGSLLELMGRKLVRESEYPAECLVTRDKWTEYEISAIGNHIQIRVNGLKTLDMVDKKGPKRGFIALQMCSPDEARIEWTDVRVLEIPSGANWQSLFNGDDLTGWRPLGDAKWSVIDGAIVGKSESKDVGYGWLVSENEYADFYFSTRFYMPKGNSGIQFRSWQVENMINGFQADLASDSDWISGHLYDQGERGVFVKTEKDFTNLINWDGWNTYEITAIGPKVQLFINGIQSIECVDPTRTKKGVFAFQMHAGIAMQTTWKDIRLISFDGLEKK
ncbi:MAG: DUF1080 domain-containing protein [bacterium]